MKLPALIVVLSIVFLEWLDFTLYLYLAKAVFAPVFFPKSADSLMLTFALFAAGYLARPVGGWLFGREADIEGRRKPMIFTAALMGFSMLGICLLPGYSQWGITSTWCLLFLRIGQGLALGGEVNTSAMFLIEHHKKSPLLAGSTVAAFGAIGMFMGGAIAAFIQWQAIPWLWRIIFAAVGIISIGVCRLRKKLKESPEFTSMKPATAPWYLYWRGLINIAAAGAFVSVTVYLCNVFWISFAIDQQLWSNVECAWIAAFAQFSSALLALPIAYYGKPQSGKRLLQAGMLMSILTAPSLFYFTTIHWKIAVIFSIAGYVLTNALLCSSLFYFLYRQLPTQYRCRGVSTIWALAASLGAIALPLAENAVSVHHLLWMPGALVAIVSSICVITIQINKTTDWNYTKLS